MQRHWDTEWTMTFLPLITPNPYSLLIPLLMAVILEQVLYLQSFGQLGERLKILPESFGPLLFSTQTNPQAKETS